MAKQLLYSEEARKKLKAGVDALANAVGTTLGPKGRNVALDKKWGAPSITHDGVTVAKEIELEDPFENMGAQLVKEAASKTNDAAGDGTTTATILAQAIINDGLKNITAGLNPMEIRNGLEKASRLVVEEIKKLAKPVSSQDEKEQIATIAAASAEIGKKIAEALAKVGDAGVVTVEESKGLDLDVEYKEGMQLDKGYASPYFITNAERMEAVVDDPYILVTDQKISNLQELLPVLENLVKVTKNVVFIAEDFEGEALATLVVNKLRGTFSPLAIKAPGFGDRRKEMLKDIAVLTGANVISEETGRKLDSVTIDDLGRADRVVADKDEAIIVGGKGDKAALESRIAQIQKQIEAEDSDYSRENLEKRLAKLAGGVAVISVGAATEVELKEKKDRVEDAVNATKAAVEEGIVPGGGVAFLRARKVLQDFAGTEGEKVAANILYNALSEPVVRLVENAGKDAGQILYIIEGKDELSYGYDVRAMEFGNLTEKGIIDPAKVARSALRNAVSVAMMVLTTEALVTDLPEKEPPMPAPGGAPGMGGMGMM